MSKAKIMLVFGTRPEAIKMGPVVQALAQCPELEPQVVLTGQHAELVDDLLPLFGITPLANLRVMATDQTLTAITTRVLTRLAPILAAERPRLVLVHGDTTTTMAAALAAFYQQIPVGHVEAGLRTGDLYAPFPEEANRRLTDQLSQLYFAPTPATQQNLVREGHPQDWLTVTGNTAIDALQTTLQAAPPQLRLAPCRPGRKLLLLTMHRRENHGAPMRRALTALRDLLVARDDFDLIYPVHPSPAVQAVAHEVLDGIPGVQLVAPLDPVTFHHLVVRATLILTDSGGVQEEAPALNKPVLVLREETERPEGVAAGTLKLVGTQPARIKQAVGQLLDDPAAYAQMAAAQNPYGDGQAAARIVATIQDWLAQMTD